jgi:hypothetical protein
MPLRTHKTLLLTRCWWLIPVILATREAEIRRMAVQSQPRQIVHKTLSQKTLHKSRLVELLKVKALSSGPCTKKKKKKERKKEKKTYSAYFSSLSFYSSTIGAGTRNHTKVFKEFCRASC